MGMSGDTALIQAKRYVKKTLEGQGALKGQDGFSPTVKENPSNTDNDYRLDITDKNGTITTPNLKGADGSGSDYKQLKNKPSIGGVEIDGNKTLDDLGIQPKGEYLTEETDPTVPQWAKENTKPTYTASEVGADSVGSANVALSDAKEYTDNKIAELINGAPETMDTLKEIADALKTEQSTVEVLQEAIGAKLNKDGDSKDNTITFVQSETRENIDSGEKHSVLFGKIRKWLFDLKEVAFSGSYTDLSNKPSAADIGALPKDGNATSATKAINDGDGNNIAETYATKVQVDEINSNLSQLEVSDVAGGKNIIGCTNVIESSYGTLTKTESGYSVTGVYYGILEFKCEKNTDYFISYEKSGSGTNLVKAVNSSRNADIAEFNTNGGTFNSGDNETVYLYLYGGYGTSNTSIYNNFLLCKGTSGTYEPYIPSVKMLAEENAQQSNEMLDIKMLGWTVPKEMPIKNYVDSDGVFHQRVGRVDLGSLDWVYQSNYTRFYAELSNIKTVSSETDIANAYCEKYKIVSISGGTENKIIFVNNTSARIYIKDTSYTDETTFKTAMKGVYLYYELATEKTISVDGNEAVTRINDSLADYDLDNKCSNLVNGYYNADNGSLTTNYNQLRYICSTNSYYLKKGETIRVNCNSVDSIYFATYDTNGSFINRKDYYDKKDVTYIAQDNIIIKWSVSFPTNTPINQSPHIGVYVNNEIDTLKNDLEALKDAIIAMGGTV